MTLTSKINFVYNAFEVLFGVILNELASKYSERMFNFASKKKRKQFKILFAWYDYELKPINR